MEEPHLIYFADPMCSWCWGFWPVVAELRKKYAQRLPVRLVMGGLRPGTTEPMTDKAKADLFIHWLHIRDLTGQPFFETGLKRPSFVYDSDPAARAVVLARRQDAKLGFELFHAIHAAFYSMGWDVTRLEVLADLAGALGFDRAAFLADLASEALKEETWRDYAVTRTAEVDAFPTLIVGPRPDGVYDMVTKGYQGREKVLPTIEAWLARSTH